MKVKILTFIAIVLLSQNLFAQNLEDFTGIYAVNQRCWEADNNWQETTEYEVEINYATNDSTNLEMKVVLLKPYTLGFNAKNDSMFWIYTHLFLNENKTTQFVDGNGVIYKDSIDLNMNTANDSIVFKCDCNGNKVRDVPLTVDKNSVLNNAISLYPNPAKEELKVLWPILSGKSYNNFKIYTVYGQSVLENKSQLFERIDMRGLQAGVCVIHFLKDELSIASGRFVKME